MDILWELDDLLCDKIKEVTVKGDISPAEMDSIYKAVKTMYYATCIEAMDNATDDYEEGLSGNWPYQNSMRRNSRTNRNSYTNSMRRNSRANNSMANYSGHDQKEMLMQKIADLQKQLEMM